MREQSGQSTLEFILTIGLLMAFSLFFIQLSLVFGWGNYVHYATFMSARAYLSATETADQQAEAAKSVLTRMVRKNSQDRLPSVAKGEGAGDFPGFSLNHDRFAPQDRNLSWLEGVRYKFKSRLFMIPLPGSPRGGTGNTLSLTSESWLLRDPSDSECRAAMKGLIDNGC